jgi:hypothetical protein
MEETMAEIKTFDVSPLATALGGTVKLTATVSPTIEALDHDNIVLKFFVADKNKKAKEITPVTPAGPSTLTASWTAAGGSGSIDALTLTAVLVNKNTGRDVPGVPALTREIPILRETDLDVDVESDSVIEGDAVTVTLDPPVDVDELEDSGIGIAWVLDDTLPITPPTPYALTFPVDTSGLEAKAHKVTAKLVDKNGIVLAGKGGSEVADSDTMQVTARPFSRLDTLKVALQRSTPVPTKDMALWSAIRNSGLIFSGSGYQSFIDTVLGLRSIPDSMPGGALLKGQIVNTAPFVYGVGAYELLKTATQVFLLLEAGVVRINDPNQYPHQQPFDPVEESARLGEVVTRDKIKTQLTSYLGPNGRLPYLDRVVAVAFPDDDSRPYATSHSYGLLQWRAMNPSLIELIWSYWHEEGMLVQAMAAISRRFQNVRGPGDRDPLAHLEIDPLRPLNNLLWGYVQDEWNRLTLQRRAYEYDHHYGLAMYGKAVPTLRTADSRSKFVEAFHNLLHLCSVFYKEDNDTTVIADGFPLLNALKEVHLVLAQGAHNQFGDLPWTARAEMLMQQWLLARPEMRDFLQSRPMVPYKEAWMPQVDTMKTLQGWTDVTVTHFRDLGVYGEQILLSIRYGDWIGINDENSAKNWARYWRPELQGYLHAYRAVTGVDLTNPDSVDATMPAVHLQKRLASQRAR